MLAVTYDTILVDIDEAVATVTLNRPERLNAWTPRTGAELSHALTTLDDDDAVRAIVVTGAGRGFCAGADLVGGDSTFSPEYFEAGRLDTTDLAVPRRRPWELRTPVIAAINGAAVGVGLTMTLQWDIRIAAEDAKLGLVFVRRGVIPEAGSQWVLPRLIGLSRAMELMLTGKIVSGREAAEMGLVSRAVPRDDVVPAAMAVARDIAANTSALAVAVTKRLVNRLLLASDRDAALALENELFQWIGSQADSAEGVTAFIEKRPARWPMAKTTQLPLGL